MQELPPGAIAPAARCDAGHAAAHIQGVSREVLAEKERTIAELRESNEVRGRAAARRCLLLLLLTESAPRAAACRPCAHVRGLWMRALVCSILTLPGVSSAVCAVLCCAASDSGDKGAQAGAACEAEGCKDPDAGGQAAGRGRRLSGSN